MNHRSLLFVAHPGHELLVHRWMEIERPLVLVLTDGSGKVGVPRLEHSRRVILAAGAVPGPVFGVVPDRAVYRAILARDVGFFAGLIARTAAALLDSEADVLVSDPVEACEPAHDLCAVIARLAAARASARRGRTIRHFDFPIEVRGSIADPRPDQRVSDLDAAAVARKLEAAVSVPALADERERLLRLDPRLIEREILSPVISDRPLLPAPEGEPFYERQGRERVAQGIFHEVITYARHLAPLVADLATTATSEPAPAPDSIHAG